MNRLITFSRILSGLVVMVVVGDMSAISLPSKDKIVFTTQLGLVNEKQLGALFGEKRVSARDQVVIYKALLGGANSFKKNIDARNTDYSYYSIDTMSREEYVGQEIPAAYMKGAGYVVINGGLRLAADKYSLNEKYIDQTCDEYLPENIAWIAKPVANVAVDLAYDYVTVQLVKGIAGGINKIK